MDKKKIDAHLKELEEEISLLAGHLGGAVAEQLDGPLKELDGRIESLLKSMPSGGGKTADITAGELKEVRAALDSIATTLGKSGEKDHQALAARIDGLSESVTKDISGILDRIDKTTGDSRTVVTDLGKELATTIDKEVSELGKDIRDTLGKKADDISARIDDQTKTLSAATGKAQTSLADDIAGLAKKADEITALMSSDGGKSIASQITDMAATVRDSTAALPKLPEQLKKELAAVDESIGKRFDTASGGIEEAKTTLMKDHDELHRSLEIIRRMCTTDEEKYLGTLVSIMHERLGEVAAGLPDLTGTVKQKLSVLDKNLQVASQNTMTKQDEVKKLLLYDITGIADVAKEIRDLCDTGSSTSLGEEAARTGERIEQVATDVPEVLARVTDIASGMEQLSAQVRLMRWFVVGAVGVSLVVLALSVFLR